MESPDKVAESWFGYLEICFEEQNQNKHFKKDLVLLLCPKIMKKCDFQPKKILHLEAMVNLKTPIKPRPTQKTFLVLLRPPTNFIWPKKWFKKLLK